VLNPYLSRTKPIFCYHGNPWFLGTHILTVLNQYLTHTKPYSKNIFFASGNERLRRRVLRLHLSFCKLEPAIARSRQKETNADCQNYCHFAVFTSEKLTFEMPCISIVTFWLRPVPLKGEFAASEVTAAGGECAHRVWFASVSMVCSVWQISIDFGTCQYEVATCGEAEIWYMSTWFRQICANPTKNKIWILYKNPFKLVFLTGPTMVWVFEALVIYKNAIYDIWIWYMIINDLWIYDLWWQHLHQVAHAIIIYLLVMYKYIYTA
jgi:hypothetical protein